MKFHYYVETDSLYVELSDKASTDSQEVASGVVLDFDDSGMLVGIDIDQASKVTNLATLQMDGFSMSSLSLIQ